MQREVVPITYTLEQVGRLLGISRAFVYGLLDRGELPSLKIGSRRRILQTDIDAYLERLRAADATTRARKNARKATSS